MALSYGLVERQLFLKKSVFFLQLINLQPKSRNFLVRVTQS